MCVIICRDPGIEIPEDKLMSACEVNPDGYGLSVVDRGKLTTIKELPKGGNRAAALIKRLEDAKDHQVFLHLRFRTHGPTNEENCHPFNVTDINTDGAEIQMMHNGVLSRFTSKTDKFSDTWHFNEQILKPLITRMLPYHLKGNTNILDDDLVQNIIEEYCGSGSKIVLFDNNGKHLIANRKLGKEYEGWWASNDYSFNRYHRTSSTGYYTGHNNWGRSSGVYSATNADATPWQDDPNFEPPHSKEASKGMEKATSKEEVKKGVGSLVSIANTTAKHVNPTIIPPSMRDTFVELVGITRLDQLTVMEKEDIEEMVGEYPEAAVILIMDLLHELYIKNKNDTSGIGNV